MYIVPYRTFLFRFIKYTKNDKKKIVKPMNKITAIVVIYHSK